MRLTVTSLSSRRRHVQGRQRGHERCNQLLFSSSDRAPADSDGPMLQLLHPANVRMLQAGAISTITALVDCSLDTNGCTFRRLYS